MNNRSSIMKFNVAWLLAFPVIAAAGEGERQCAAASTVEAEIRSSLATMISDYGFPGFSYAVASREGLVFSGGIGVADRDSGRASDAGTVYQAGSVTKVVTGLLLARLVAEDRVELGDPLRKHWFPGDEIPTDAAGNDLTLSYLGTHTAGVPRYPDNLDRVDGDPILGYSLSRMREAVSGLEPEGTFPKAWSYSNFGYGILATALANSQGISFAELVARQIIEPLDMRDSAFTLSDEMVARLATPYRDDDVTVATEPWKMEAMSAAGGLFTTVNDMARLATWQLGGNSGALGAREVRARQLQQAPLVRREASTNQGYGLGMFVVDNYVDGVDVNWHGGDVDGYAGSYVLLPDHDVALIYFTNSGKADGFAEFQSRFIARLAEMCR